MTREILIDACVRRAMAEAPDAVEALLADDDLLPDATRAVGDIPLTFPRSPLMGLPWAHFVARVRDLFRSHPSQAVIEALSRG